MSLEQKLQESITTIVKNECRPASIKDLLYLECYGTKVKYSSGSIRNALSKLHKEGKIYTVYKSPQAFYSIPGVNFGKNMTPTYITGIPNLNNKQRTFLKFLRIHKLEYPSIHDIRLTFECNGLRTILLNMHPDLIKSIDENSNKDVILNDITLDDITLKTTVHNTDKISVMVACSENPIPIDLTGIAKLSSALTRVEERLQSIIDTYFKDNIDQSTNNNVRIEVPYHMNWIVTMWHFGYDSVGFTGEQFEITWREGLDVFRLYSKKRSAIKVH